MAAERLSMRQIREILRQKWALGLSHRAVARSLGVGLGTISSIVSRAQTAGPRQGSGAPSAKGPRCRPAQHPAHDLEHSTQYRWPFRTRLLLTGICEELL
jgi:hypothetical protein